MIIKVKNSEPLPTGEYVAMVDSVTEDSGNYGPQLKWTLQIIEPACFAGKQLFTWTNTSSSLKGKLAKYVLACLGRGLVVGQVFDTEQLPGSIVTVVAVVETRDDGTEYTKVESLKALKIAKTPPTNALEDEDIFS